MKTRNIIALFFLIVTWSYTSGQNNIVIEEQTAFEFAFLTDIHIKPEMNAPEGFQMAIDKVNELNPDFVLTGGDLVYDVMRGNQERSDSLFSLYKEMIQGFKAGQSIDRILADNNGKFGIPVTLEGLEKTWLDYNKKWQDARNFAKAMEAIQQKK